jgi:alpha-L-fucosidase
MDLTERMGPWTTAPMVKRSAPGRYTVEVKGLRVGRTYEYRAVVRHPLLDVYGEEKRLNVK